MTNTSIPPWHDLKLVCYLISSIGSAAKTTSYRDDAIGCIKDAFSLNAGRESRESCWIQAAVNKPSESRCHSLPRPRKTPVGAFQLHSHLKRSFRISAIVSQTKGRSWVQEWVWWEFCCRRLVHTHTHTHTPYWQICYCFFRNKTSHLQSIVLDLGMFAGAAGQ